MGAQCAGFGLERGEEGTADAPTADRRDDVHALELGVVVVEPADGAAADRGAVGVGDQEGTAAGADLVGVEAEVSRAGLGVEGGELGVEGGDEAGGDVREDAGRADLYLHPCPRPIPYPRWTSSGKAVSISEPPPSA